MQYAKDSFYMALRARLAALDNTRTVIIGDTPRPAIAVAENEPASCAPLPPRAFILRWGQTQIAAGAESCSRPLMKMDCEIHYRTSGDNAGATRGRDLCALDLELLQICSPPRTSKCDFSHTPPVSLAGAVFWSGLEFLPAETHGSELRRIARLQLFYFPEVKQA